MIISLMFTTWILAGSMTPSIGVLCMPHNLDRPLLHQRHNSLEVVKSAIKSLPKPASYEVKDGHSLHDYPPFIPTPNVTYMPPPKTGETGALLNQSLTFQPNNTATIVSVMPYFSKGVLSFTIQLNGIVAASLIVNASSALPCDTIGLTPEPDLVILPQMQRGANASTVITDCDIIAVNMYNPNVVNY